MVVCVGQEPNYRIQKKNPLDMGCPAPYGSIWRPHYTRKQLSTGKRTSLGQQLKDHHLIIKIPERLHKLRG